MGLVGEALTRFNEETGHYPDSEQGLEALNDEHRKGGSLLRVVPRDGWGKPLVYKLTHDSDREPFLLYSVGSDGVDDGGSGDDISYWSEQVQKELTDKTRKR